MRILLFMSIFWMSLFAIELTPIQLQMFENAGYSKQMIENKLKEKKSKSEEKEQVIVNNIKKENIKEENSEIYNKNNVSKTFSDAITYHQKEINKKEINKKEELKRFASTFFRNENKIDPYSIPIPKDYKLTRSDVLSVVIYGAFNKEFNLKIDRKGNITLPQVGDIKILGLSFSEAKNLIIHKSEEAYPSNTNIIVNIVEFSAIQVTMAGLVQNPGLYNLSSFSTIKDALITSGGMSDSGSYRNIVLKRDGKIIKTFDLYDLIIKGNSSSDAVLQSGDIIYVSSIKKQVKLSGEVFTQGIYELKKTDSFKNLLSFASGLKASANKKAIRLKRYEDNSILKVYTLSLNELYKTLPKDGDELFIYPISISSGNLVTLSGNVEVEGEIEIPKDKKLSTLFKKQLEYFGQNALFKQNTNFSYGKVENIRKSKAFNLSDVLEKKEDIILENGDNVIIYKKDEIKDSSYFLAKGSVINDKSRKIDFYEGLEVKDIFSLVIFKNEINKKENINEKDEYSYVDRTKVQIRRIENNKFKTYIVNIKENPKFSIKAYDEVTFFDIEKINDLMKANIKGEVFISGSYDINEGSTINELIYLSGGLRKKALKTHFELVRYDVKDDERIRSVKKLNLQDALTKKMKIKADDEITILGIANWYEKEYVVLEGEVKHPGKYAITKGEKLSSVINRAGGFTSNAFLEGAVFTRDEIRLLQQKRLKESMDRLKRKSLQLSSMATEAGQSIEDKTQMLSSINELEGKVASTMPIGRVSLNLYYDMQRFEQSDFNITLKDKDTLYIPTINDTVSVVGEVLNQNTFVFNRELNTEDYIKRAGGITEVADADMIYIVKANGEAIKYEKSFFMSSGTQVFKGDTIVVPLKFDTISDIKFAKDITSILYQLAVTAASLKTVGAI